MSTPKDKDNEVVGNNDLPIEQQSEPFVEKDGKVTFSQSFADAIVRTIHERMQKHGHLQPMPEPQAENENSEFETLA